MEKDVPVMESDKAKEIKRIASKVVLLLEKENLSIEESWNVLSAAQDIINTCTFNFIGSKTDQLEFGDSDSGTYKHCGCGCNNNIT